MSELTFHTVKGLIYPEVGLTGVATLYKVLKLV